MVNDDLISRQAALYSYQYEVCNKVKCYDCKATDEDGTCKLERWIKELPSAERLGTWTTKRTMYHDGEWYCSVCGYEPIVYEATNYCPNCGARMEAGE